MHRLHTVPYMDELCITQLYVYSYDDIAVCVLVAVCASLASSPGPSREKGPGTHCFDDVTLP